MVFEDESAVQNVRGNFKSIDKRETFSDSKKKRIFKLQQTPWTFNFLRSKTKLRKLLNNQAGKFSELAKKIQVNGYSRKEILKI